MDSEGPQDRRELTFEEREAAARVMWVILAYISVVELQGARRPDYLQCLEHFHAALNGFKEKLRAEREEASQKEKALARKGQVDDSGWTNDLINDQIAAMSNMLKGIDASKEQQGGRSV